jgi:hypothetical protein
MNTQIDLKKQIKKILYPKYPTRSDMPCPANPMFFHWKGKSGEKAQCGQCGQLCYIPKDKKVSKLLALFNSNLKEEREWEKFAHPTKDNWCCACDYDKACLEDTVRKIIGDDKKKQQEFQKWIDNKSES